MLTPLTDDDPRTIGPYRIANRIGAGGMGTVYLGFGADGRSAAVKVPSPGLAHDPEFRARFRQEVTAARLVRGRRVAAVLDADAEGERPWMATEFVEGSSLTDAVRAHGRFEGPMLTSLATGLAEALVAIHAAGVIHRDLKPSNVLLAWDGPKVIDFGIARAMDATRHTRTGMLVGTMVWMAPEQLLGERAGPAADVFAWGACVAFAGTGKPPFRGERAEAVGLQIVQGEPDLEGLPAEVGPIVWDTLAKDPAARPTSAELVDRLAAASGGTSVTARLGGAGAAAAGAAGLAAASGATGAPTGRAPARGGTGGTRPEPPGPAPYPPRRHAGNGRSRAPVGLAAAAVLVLIVAAAVVAAVLASGGDDTPPGNVGTPPSATATAAQTGTQDPTSQPSPEDSGNTPAPTGTASATTEPSPTETPSPTPSRTASPTPSPTPSPTATTPPPDETPSSPPPTGNSTPIAGASPGDAPRR